MSTKEQLLKAIDGELTGARLKEAKGKLKQAAQDVNAAKAVLTEKEAVITDICEEYADVILNSDAEAESNENATTSDNG